MSTVALTLCDVPVTAALFTLGNAEHLYVASQLDYPAFHERYTYADSKHQYKLCTPVELDSTPCRSDRFWLCCVVDCFDPPCAVVKADDVSDAIDAYVDACPGAALSPECVAERERDGLGETVGWTGQGTAYDAGLIDCRELRLVRVDVD